MKKEYEHIILRLFYLLIFCAIIIVFSLHMKRHDKISFKNDVVYTLSDGWNYIETNGENQPITLQAVLDIGENKTVTISCKLPASLSHLTSIGVLTTHQSVRAFLGNKEIYFRPIHTESHLLNVPVGTIWDDISLPPGSDGKIFTLQFKSEYEDYAGVINEIHAGTTSSLLLHNIKTFGLSFLLSLIIFINSIILIVLYYFLRKLLTSNKGLLFLGWFSMLSSIWMLTESNLTQIFIDNAFIISSLSYLSLMTFPLPILIYIITIEGFHYKKIVRVSIYALLFSDFIIMFLQLFNIFDFHKSLPVVRGELVIILGIALITLFLETFHHKNNDIRIFTISSAVLFGFGLLELYFYIKPSDKIHGNFFQFGFYIFILLLAWDIIKKAVDIIKLSESAKHYKYLATRDLLTSCRSRISYAKDIDRIDLSKNITLFMIDMNHMKQINDTFGHQAGDEALILSSQCLLKVFGRRVYRIGGDEFVCIAYDLTEEDINNMLTALDAECVKASEDVPYTVSMSAGYATYDKTIDKSIYDTVKRADQVMYKRKQNTNSL